MPGDMLKEGSHGSAGLEQRTSKGESEDREEQKGSTLERPQENDVCIQRMTDAVEP